MFHKKRDPFDEGRFRFRRVRKVYQSRGFWWVSCVFLLAVLAVTIVTVLIPSDPDKAPAKAVAAAQSAATAVPVPSPTPEPEVSFTGCKAQKAPPIDPEFRAPAPVQTTWTRQGPGGLQAPSSATGGPKVHGVCFTRTPEGALYSAANFLVEFMALDSEGRKALMAQRYYNPGGPQVEQGAPLPTLLNQRPAQDVPDAARQFTGYRWETWTPDLAIVSIAFRWISGQMTGAVYLATYTLTWADNDWKLVSPGADGVPVHYVTGESAAAAQYTPWGP